MNNLYCLGEEINVEINNRHAENLGGKPVERDFVWKSNVKKLPVHRNLESQVQPQGRIYAQKILEKTLSFCL